MDLSQPRARGLALAVLCASMLMIILDGSVVSVALPAIQDGLGFTDGGLTWTVNAYMIAFGGLLLLSGRLGDLLGRRTVFVAGLAVFTLASLLCGVAASPAALVAARFVQGAGGALASAVALGMLVTIFTGPRERGRALGAYAFVGAAGASIGQVLGGVLADRLGWHWIFLVNLPIGAAAIVLALRVLPADAGLGLRAGADALGAVLATSGLMLAVYAIVQTGGHGWTSARTLALGGVAALLLAGFVVRQATAATPLLPLRMFRSRNVWGANLAQLLLIGAMFGFQFFIALYMQRVLGYGATATGFAMLPAAVAIGAASLLLSARLSARFGERAVLVAGLVLLLASRYFLLVLPVDGSYAADVLPLMVLCFGAGLAMPALTGLGMSGARPEDAGIASGLFNTSQQIGAALGVAVASTVAGRTPGTAPDALNDGYRAAFGVGAVLLVAALAVALAVQRRVRPSVTTEPALTKETVR